MANVSTFDAAVYQAITLLPNQLITACIAKAHIATNDWLNIAGIAMLDIFFNNSKSINLSTFSKFRFFNLLNKTMTDNIAITIHDIHVARAVPAIHRLNVITNNKSNHIFKIAEIIRKIRVVLESHNALKIAAAISYINKNTAHTKIIWIYCNDHQKIFSGVANKLSRGFDNKNHIKLIINQIIHEKIRAVYDAFLTFFISLAQKIWDITTFAHVDNPIKTEINKKNIGNAAPTDANAVSEINFQTIIVSVIL